MKPIGLILQNTDHLDVSLTLMTNDEFKELISRLTSLKLKRILFCQNEGEPKEVCEGSFEFLYWVLYRELERNYKS